MPDLLQPWTEVHNIVLTNRKHRHGDFVIVCPRDAAAFAFNRVAVNVRARDERFLPDILFSLEHNSELTRWKAIYEFHPQPVLVVKPGESIRGRLELSPTAELDRKRPLIQIIISGVKNYGTANEQPPGPQAPAGGNEKT